MKLSAIKKEYTVIIEPQVFATLPFIGRYMGNTWTKDAQKTTKGQGMKDCWWAWLKYRTVAVGINYK